MKKVIAIVLALVMAMGCTAIAFAADTTTTSTTESTTAKIHQCPTCQKKYTDIEAYNACIEKHEKAASVAAEITTQCENECPYCHNTFHDESKYDDHIEICYSQNGGVENNHDNFFNLTANQILDMLHDFFTRETDLWSAVSGIIIRIIDLFENLGTAAATEADVAGAVDELEAKVASLPIIGDALEYVHNLINTLKQKIKDIYAHDAETAAEEPVSTGSSSIGVVAFATVSVAAAAFVCTKKKED